MTDKISAEDFIKAFGGVQNNECEIGKHHFVRYNAGNYICEKCGRFAKIGYMKGGENNGK